jgi:hypothetical protein
MVQRAWESAQEVGEYHFSSAVDQTTIPAPAIANVGRSSQRDQYYLEGDVDQSAQSLNLMFWSGSGNLVTQKDGVEIRIEGNQAYGRPIGGIWKEIEAFSGGTAFAPGSDPLAYLAGAKNIQPLDGGMYYTRYTFDVDGPAFAAYVRERLEDQLRRSGKLPAGMTLDTPRAYREMGGQGEIWLDKNGLPLRLAVDLDYPVAETGERVSASIQTDFSGFPVQAEEVASQSENSIAWLSQFLDLPRSQNQFQQSIWETIIILGSFALVGLFLVFHRSKHVYLAVVIAVIFSMLVTPLLQSYQVGAV